MNINEHMHTPTNNSLATEVKVPVHRMRHPYLAIAVVSMIGMFGIFAFLAQHALPGSSLYGFKTNTLQTLGEKSNATPQEKAQYQITHMENRLAEVKKLTTQKIVSQKAQDALFALMQQHQKELFASINMANSGITEQNALSLLVRFESVTGAIEILSKRSPALQDFNNNVYDLHSENERVISEKVDRFVEKETLPNIFTFISDQLAQVTAQLKNSQTSEETLHDAQKYIDMIGDALTHSDFPKAINEINLATQLLQIENYTGILKPITAITPFTQDNHSSTTASTTR